jgi:hypothetical protein
MELENIILSEVSQVQVQKAKGMFFLICGISTQYKYKQFYEKTGHAKGWSLMGEGE